MNLTQNPNLEGLRDNLLAPIDIIRDEDGHFYHPALPLTDENVSPRKLLEAFGLQAEFVSIEDDCADKTLLESVSDGGSCAAWEPSPPAGDGWVLLAIYDTEDGVIAWFAQPEPDAIWPTRRRDDAAVDRFAAAMKAKMASARAKGRSGWDDPQQCTVEHLSDLLRLSLQKGDPVDLATFAMMLHQRGSLIVRPSLAKLIDAINAAPKDSHGVLVDGKPVFINRGTSEQDYCEMAQHEHQELEARITGIKYLAGEITLQMPDDAEVPQSIEAGMKATLLIEGERAAQPEEPAQIDLYTGQESQKPAQCWSVDNEEFPYDTLGELIDNSDNLVVGSTVYVADAVTPDPASYIDMDDILTQMGERATDDCGEYAEDYPDVDNDAKQSLEAFLKNWARKHCTPTNFYTVQNVREHVLTAADLE